MFPRALTGPIDRGDASTISRHMEKMKEAMPQIMEIYRVLGRFTAVVAEEKGTLSEEGEREHHQSFIIKEAIYKI